MRVLHQHLDCMEPVSANEGQDLGRLVIGHQEFDVAVIENLEEARMVNVVVRVKSPAGAFAARGIWRVNEGCDLGAGDLDNGLEEGESIRFAETDAVGVRSDRFYAPRDSPGIPTRCNSFPVFAGTRQGCPRGEYAAAARTVEYEGAESVFQHVGWGAVQEIFHGGARRLEAQNSVAKSGAVVYDGMPKGRYVMIYLGHEAMIRQALHYRGERYGPASGKWFYEQWRRLLERAKPGADMRHQPSFTAGIAQWTALRHGSDIDCRDRRNGNPVLAFQRDDVIGKLGLHSSRRRRNYEFTLFICSLTLPWLLPDAIAQFLSLSRRLANIGNHACIYARDLRSLPGGRQYHPAQGYRRQGRSS